MRNDSDNRQVFDRTARGTDGNERGVALLLALMFTFIAGSVIINGAMMLRTNREVSETRFRQENQAAQFARSGLTEAISWFRRQPTQPVTEFKPLLDETANPPVRDTDEPEIGLVRSFRLTGDIWGRYEVWRKNESDPRAIRLDFRRKYEAKDLSAQRGFATPGNVWLVRSIGYVYQRRSTTAAWNEKPNRVLAVATFESEIQRLSLQLPKQSAICISRGDKCTIGSQGRVRGGGTAAGIVYPNSTGTPSTGPVAENRVTGSPSKLPVADYDDSVRSVFGVSRNELRAMADLVITNPADFPDPIPANSIVFVETSSPLVFDAARSLNGTGIIYIQGDMGTISGNNSNFNGLLYVDGDMLLEDTADVFGCIISKGALTVRGSGDYASTWYDDDVLTALRREVGQYRFTGAFRSVLNRE